MRVRIIKESQELMKNLYLEKDSKRGTEKTVLKLMEEMGELAESVLLEDEEKIKEEIVDIIAWTLSIANILKIDVSSAFKEKYDEICPRCSSNPCSCDSI